MLPLTAHRGELGCVATPNWSGVGGKQPEPGLVSPQRKGAQIMAIRSVPHDPKKSLHPVVNPEQPFLSLGDWIFVSQVAGVRHLDIGSHGSVPRSDV